MLFKIKNGLVVTGGSYILRPSDKRTRGSQRLCQSYAVSQGYKSSYRYTIQEVLPIYNPKMEQNPSGSNKSTIYLLTGDRRQTKQFCFLDADCLVVGESQSSSRRLARKYPVKPPRPEGDSQTIDTYQCRNT